MPLFRKSLQLFQQRAKLKTILSYSGPTYSQYAEDVIIARLLQPGSRGTYVDVGANHPIEGSNTYRLYTRGWAGLAIDPNPRFAPLFRKFRPHDTFVNEGVASVPGDLTYFEFAQDGFNTLDPGRADALTAGGNPVVGRRNVKCRPLSEMVDEHLGGRPIDLLSVDCEGRDYDVLRSLDLRARRPAIVIVEDHLMYLTFQHARDPAPFERFLREQGYLPIAQSAWSAVFVAEDWSELFKRSQAFREELVQNSYMPGQMDVSELDRASVGADHNQGSPAL